MFFYFISTLIFCNTLLASSNTQELSAKVIELRKEVELLNDEYKTEREKVLSEIKALSVQKAELASNIRNEEIRKKQFNDKITQLRKEIETSSVESDDLDPVVQKALTELESWISKSLPFKRQERLDSVATLRKRLEKKEITLMKAANQIWALIEDEKRLARETSLHKQTIPLNGEMHLSEVVKVGMMFLYFKTDRGEIGMAVNEGGEWVYKTFESESKQSKTVAFFESLKKQIRQGSFEIPTEI